jgi:hypothetical protein
MRRFYERWQDHRTSSTSLLRPLTADDRAVVERLWQLYSHDMSDVRGTMPNSEGLYKAGRLPAHLDEPGRAVGTDWQEERRPVPGKPHIPHDHFTSFSS